MYHKPVFDNRSFGECCVNLTALKSVADLNLHCDVPKFVFVKRRNSCTTVDKCARLFLNSFKRTFNSVKNIVNNTRSQKHVHRCSRTPYGVAGFKTCCFLVNLNGSKIIGDTDNLADKILLSDVYHFHHLKAVGLLYGNNRTVNSVYNIVVFHLYYHLFRLKLTVKFKAR